MAVAQTRIVFHPDVTDDLAAIVEYYGGVDRSLPASFRTRFREQLDHLTTYPESGTLLFDDFRRIVIKRFPYLIVYLRVDDEVRVLAVASFRRDPEWIRLIAASRSVQPDG